VETLLLLFLYIWRFLICLFFGIVIKCVKDIFSFFDMRGLYTILLLVLSNTFMTFAWYGHLKFKEMKWTEGLGLVAIVLISWGIAFFEYCFQVPANRIGYHGNGGPFSLLQLKVIQEVIALLVFTVFSIIFLKTETFRLNHLIGFVFLVLSVYFIFKK
jgi:uncharacterized protein